MSVTSEQKLVTMAENYYLDLRGSFDESIDKVAGSVAQTPPDNNNGCFCSSSRGTTIILELVFSPCCDSLVNFQFSELMNFLTFLGLLRVQ